MKTSTSNFWSSFECFCVSAGFDYEKDYLRLMENHTHAPLCRAAYDKINEAFNIQLDHDLGNPKE